MSQSTREVLEAIFGPGGSVFKSKARVAQRGMARIPNKLGVVEVGAYADLLLVDGNPLGDITVIGGNPKMFDAPDRTAGDIPTMRLIMKDGRIYKNTL